MTVHRVSHRARRYQVLLVDDHPVFCDGLANLIESEPGIRVCGRAADQGRALELMAQFHPDLAIVDLALEKSNGLDLIREARVRFPQVALLVVSVNDETVYGGRCIRAGARGYVEKRQAGRQIAHAIRVVRSGGTYVSDDLARKLAAGKVQQPGSVHVPRIEDLSKRETDIFRSIGRGCSPRQIEEELHLSRPSVDSYRKRIKIKLNLKDGDALRQTAIDWTHRGSEG